MPGTGETIVEAMEMIARLWENHLISFAFLFWSKGNALFFFWGGGSAFTNSEYLSSFKVRFVSHAPLYAFWLTSGHGPYRYTGNIHRKDEWMSMSAWLHILMLSHPLQFHEGISHLHAAWCTLPFCLSINSLRPLKFSSWLCGLLHSRQN